MAYRIKFKTNSKFIKTDAWRGYSQPVYAVAGSSDTGMWSDSPAPSNEVKRELGDYKAYMKQRGFNVKEHIGKSSNVFMIKRWVIVPPEQYDKAKEATKDFFKNARTTYMHEAD